MTAHGYRHLTPHVKRGKCVLTTHVPKLTYDNLAGLAKIRGVSLSSFTVEVLEFGLMELEDQGLVALKRE
jgi:hypothetical protein